MPKGLIEAQQEEEPAAPQEEAPAEPQDAAPMEGAQPENENRMKIVLAAMKVMYEGKTSDAIVQMLHKGEPGAALAQTALFIMKALYDQSKGTLPPQDIAPAATHVLQLLVEVAAASGVKLNEQALAQSYQLVQQSLAKRFPPQGATAQQAPAQPAPAQAAPQPAPQAPQGV